MTHILSLRAACACLALLNLMALSACGGGGGGAAGTMGAESTAVSPGSRPAPAADAAVPPITDEAVEPSQNEPEQLSATSLVPVVGPLTYAVAPDELIRNNLFASGLAWWNWALTDIVPSERRSGGQALRVTSNVVQPLPAGTLVPGRSYILTVTGRNLQSSGRGTVAVRFRRPVNQEVYRIYKSDVVFTYHHTYSFGFTVPAYGDMPEVAVTTNGRPVIIDSISLKARSAAVQTEPVTSTAGSHVPAGYALAFNDEFNGNALNRRKWFTRYLGGADHLNDEKQRYRDNDNHRVGGGLLSLVARKVSTGAPEGADYESGMIRSDWTTRYGYFEARVRMPGGKGVWPAFWLNSDVSEAGRQGWPPEIDIFEFVNNGQDDKVNMLHTGVISQTGAKAPYLYADPAVNTTWGFWWAPFNFNEGWHTIASEWTPAGVTTYVDGRKIATRAYTWTYADGAQAGPAHILLNLAIGGSWAGRYGIDDAAFPQALQIDWVRAYKKVE
jgi:beta-glucanase (GH16 family)